MAPRSDSSTVTTFNDNGWSSAGLACLVGISAPVVTTIGADSSCHLSEELKNASWILPRSMLATALTNYILGFIMLGMSIFHRSELLCWLILPSHARFLRGRHRCRNRFRYRTAIRRGASERHRVERRNSDIDLCHAGFDHCLRGKQYHN